MKRLHFFALAFLLCLGAAVPAAGQIVITAGDVGSFFTPGNAITSRNDSVTHSVDIGVPGATSWNFSGLVNNFSGVTVFVDPETTAAFGSFPEATQAIQVGTGYSYFKLSANLEALGYAQPSPTQVLSKQIPPQVINQLPMSMGTTWTSSYVDSSYVVISGTTYPSATNHVVQNTVDAYGTLTVPGGNSYQALRLKTDRTVMTGVFTIRSITYQFITKEGASVTVVASDTNQPASGTISVTNSSWVIPSNPTSVGETPSGGIPQAFSLGQNYPNPFNPSTTLDYALPRDGFVQLSVFNVLGEQVAELVNGSRGAGSYTVRWDASALPGGVYYYRLTTGNFSETRKMVLIR